MTAKPYWHDGKPGDADHPEPGYFVLLDDGDGPRVFGPFSTENHAHHFALHVENQHDHDH